jgi:predicted nucleotidyltransferase
MYDTGLDPNTRKAIDHFLYRARQSFDIQSAILYGSWARGDFHSESDVDILIVVSEKFSDVFSITLEMSDIAFDILIDYGVNISPLPVWIGQWEHPTLHANPDLLYTISNEGIRL